MRYEINHAALRRHEPVIGSLCIPTRETEVVIPAHDQVVRDEVPAESGRKIPVVQTYNP